MTIFYAFFICFFYYTFFLSLHFPGDLVDDERVKASYDVDKDEMSIEIPKKNPGEEFPDLDLLTKLLAPRKRRIAHDDKPSIEIIGESKSGDGDDNKLEEELLIMKLSENNKFDENNNEEKRILKLIERGN